MSDDLLAGLNEAQLRAVQYRGGPLLVVAGPGSGKTRVISYRIASLVGDGVRPDRILALTFTNRAAREMSSRVSELVPLESAVPIGTFHWMGNAILRRRADRLGIPRDFRLLGPGEARQTLKRAAANAGIETGVGSLATVVSTWKNRGKMTPAAGSSQAAIRSLITTYERELRVQKALDLDDLLLLTARLLEEDELVRQEYRHRFDEILVDEYQDTNPVQRDLLRLLFPASGSLVAVGDEDQAIYGWRQAEGTSTSFLQAFPAAEVIKLEQNYRSTKHILRAAQCLIERNPDRLAKYMITDNHAGDLPICLVTNDERDEAETVAAEIARLHQQQNRPWTDIALLYRVNFQSRALEDALVRHAIPYHVVSGQRFYRRAEVRRVTAYLRLALDHSDDAAAADLLESVPGIAHRRLAMLQEYAASQQQPLVSVAASAPFLPRAVGGRVRALADRVERLSDLRSGPLNRLVDVAVEEISTEIEDLAGSDREAALENLAELRSVVREFSAGRGTLRTFIDLLTLGAGEIGGEGVQLMTIHSAKGLEFPIVFLTGLEEGVLPHRRSLERERDLEEERRLCYVGVTRARERVYLSYAHMRLLGGHAVAGSPSRFITEMGATNLTLRSSPRASSRPRLGIVKVGDRVVHTRWRSGVVQAVEGKGRDTMVTINFESAGKQRLQLCYAPLSLTVAGTE